MVELSRGTSVEWIKEQIADFPSVPKFKKERGIVCVAGGDKYWCNAYASIRLLRDKGCTLPIQCYYLGEKEKNEIIQDLLKEYNVECIDARALNETLEFQHTNLNGWECKPFSIIHSPFKNVLFLDADVFVDGDPEWQFDSEQYKTYGALFSPDFARLEPTRDIWELTGVEYRDEPEIESGIIFVDKERCWYPLLLTNKLCEYGTRFGWFGSYGDKCLFQMAFHHMQKDYYINPVGIHRLPGTMGQADLNGETRFYHRNMRKLNLLQNDPIANFPNEAQILGYIEELKSWYNPYKLPDEDVETRMLAGKKFNYVRLGIDQRPMIFGSGNAIIEGRASKETSYSVKNGKLHLLDDRGTSTATFEKWQGGWIGRWLNHEKCVAILIEEK